jgi:diketogulonate reductase-like aldo/keto reductase
MLIAYLSVQSLICYPQFHWQDYSDKGYLTALNHLQELQAEGKIAHIGLCNFDAIHTDEICASLGPGSIVSNQIQVCAHALVRHSLC